MEGEETTTDALIREVWEELGLDIKGSHIENSTGISYVIFITSFYLIDVRTSYKENGKTVGSTPSKVP